MPTINMNLPNVTQSVMRPVVVDIVRQIGLISGISKDVPIVYPGDNGQVAAAGSIQGTEIDRRARFEGNRRIFVTADESYAEEENSTDIVGRKGNALIFRDDSIDTWIAPVYATSEVVASIKFESKSKEEVSRWRDDMNMKYKMLRISPTHDIAYTYTLPRTFWTILESIGEARNAKVDTGQRFGEWLKDCMTTRMTVIGNENGQHRQFSINETQNQIQGYFNYTAENIPKPEYDEGLGVWRVTFEYRFRYQRPCGVDMHYPIIIHNTLMPEKFTNFAGLVPRKPNPNMARYDQFGWATQDMNVRSNMLKIKPEFPYIRIPEMDDFLVRGTVPGTGTFMLVLMAMEDEGDKSFNLTQLGEVTIDPDILEFIQKSEYKFIGIPGKSIFHAEVYKNNMPLTSPSVKIHEDLTLEMLVKTDLTKAYRVRLSLFTDLERLENSAIDRMKAFPKAFVKIMTSINELLAYQSDFQNLGNQKVIYPWQLSKVYEGLTGSRIGARSGPGGLAPGYHPPPGMDFELFKGIPKWVVEKHKRSRRGHMTVQTQFIAAFEK